MRRRGIVLLLLALAGCGGGEEQKLAKARSWTATAKAVGEHWMRGEVPSAYARDALKKAAGQLAQGSSPDAAGPVADLEIAVAREDRAAAARILRKLGR